MKDKITKRFRDSIRYTLACYAGNVSLSTSGRMRLKENMTFLREYVRSGRGRDALGCMVENIFLGDMDDCRYAAVIRWYDRKHPGAAPLIVACLDELAHASHASHTVGRIRSRLHVQPPLGKGKKIENKLKKVVGF